MQGTGARVAHGIPERRSVRTGGTKSSSSTSNGSPDLPVRIVNSRSFPCRSLFGRSYDAPAELGRFLKSGSKKIRRGNSEERACTSRSDRGSR